MRSSIFIMAVTTTQMSFMVIHAIDAFKVFSGFTCSTNHSLSLPIDEFEYFFN